METYLDILEAVRLGADKTTHIMYEANVCWVALRRYLTDLVAQRLLDEVKESGRKKYLLTEKGVHTLESYRKIKDELPITLESQR